MYITINSVSRFMAEFTRMHRSSLFSIEAFEALFEYYNKFDDYELNVIEICRDWGEYNRLEDVLEAYDVERFEELQGYYVTIRLDNGHVLVQD